MRIWARLQGVGISVRVDTALPWPPSLLRKTKQASSVSGPGVGVSVTSSNTGVPDISGSVYTKTQQQQSFEKQQGFHAGTTGSFLQPALCPGRRWSHQPASRGWLRSSSLHAHPGTAPAAPLADPALHHLQQDGQSGGTGQRSQNASLQQKTQINKSAYNSYNWGAN
ncbi:hypothetical protein J4Q44_G00183080 [Coregonus suidteri]|uniref:Uncharacterized protein n=1 Tax=Coregonus suidteri TaxID=861788 RepID=A0AAN8LGI4_9TELE